MFNLDEAIKHCGEVANGMTAQGKCPECAEEHKQLAEWLRELKMYREMIPSASEVFIAEIRKESD